MQILDLPRFLLLKSYGDLVRKNCEKIACRIFLGSDRAGSPLGLVRIEIL
jgi:hypothetical protein